MLTKISQKNIKITNLDKVFWPQENISKGDLFKYYLEIKDYVLPHLYDRPFVMKRYPDGITGNFFYQKQAPKHTPTWINTQKVDKRDMILCNDTDTLMWLVNLGCIELHHWLSKVPNITNPDIIVFDLDPEPPAQFSHTLEVALVIRKLLALMDLDCFPKTSGSKGLHIFVPIKPNFSFTIVKEALKNLCSQLVRTFPKLVTTELIKTKRTGKVYLDYLQNGFGKTMASVYSVRPVAKALVSTPLTWQEVESGIDFHEFTIYNIKRRLETYGDIFFPVNTLEQDFTTLVKKLAYK
ncbi:MAG: non-homologous end-joining DNA ligase [Peptococcales bacterium]|jgi:bifunctional non-homologous end joining protein LigD